MAYEDFSLVNPDNNAYFGTGSSTFNSYDRNGPMSLGNGDDPGYDLASQAASNFATPNTLSEQYSGPLYNQIKNQGGDWNIGGIDRAGELYDLLSRQGISSLDGLSLNTHKYNAPAPTWVDGTGNGGDNSEPGYWTNVNKTTDAYRGGDRPIDMGDKYSLSFGNKNIGFAGNYNNDNTFGQHASPYLQSGNRVGWSARGDGNVSYNAITGADGRTRILPNWGSSSDRQKITKDLSMLGMFLGPTGALGALGGLTGATGIGANMAGAGLWGAGVSAAGGGDFGDALKAGAIGAGGAGLGSLDTAGYLGVDNDILKGAINGGFRGLVGSAMQGGNVGSSALTGALMGGLNGISAGGPSMDELPGTIGGSIDSAEGFQGGEMSPAQNEANIQAYSADPTVFNNTPTLSNQYASENPSAGAPPEQPGMLSDIFNNGIPNFNGGRVPLGDFAGGLMGLYQAYDQRRRAKKLAGQLSSNYGPNSAYAQNLRQGLQRQDAASGRRSQYGQREVDFQAKMADVNARMAPILSNLDQQVGGSTMMTANSVLNLGRLFGGKGFNGIPTSPGFPQGGGGAPGLPTLQNPMPKPNYSLGNPNATLSGINPEWLKTLGNSGG